tara:strand:+ start:1013 stop:1381 length:369 start_codon:yes stop_codon:yes gene_type:complete
MAIENISFSLNVPNTLLTIPNGKSYAITTIITCNTATVDPQNPESGSASFDIHLVTAAEMILASSVVADAISNNNRVINNLTLKAGESYSFNNEKLILEAGDTIAVLGTSVSLSATVSYLEM